MGFAEPPTASESAGAPVGERGSGLRDATDPNIKLIRLTATVDGSGKFVFTPESIRYEHQYWSRPTAVMLDGVSWPNLNSSPSGWALTALTLDLMKARIVSKKGRDTIAIEPTPQGFNLRLVDSPNGKAPYEVTIAIPRRR